LLEENEKRKGIEDEPIFLSYLLTKGNWIVKDAEYEYLLNVCNEVHDVAECAGYGACQLKPSEPDFVKQMGKDTARPVMEVLFLFSCLFFSFFPFPFYFFFFFFLFSFSFFLFL